VASTVPHSARDPGELAIELRTSVTPVIGYLELLAEAGVHLAEEELRWIATIERRLCAIAELSDELLAMCVRARDQRGSRDRGAGPL
jgi:hypothetical protein